MSRNSGVRRLSAGDVKVSRYMALFSCASEGMVQVKLPLVEGIGTEKSCLDILLLSSLRGIERV